MYYEFTRKVFPPQPKISCRRNTMVHSKAPKYNPKRGEAEEKMLGFLHRWAQSRYSKCCSMVTELRLGSQHHQGWIREQACQRIKTCWTILVGHCTRKTTASLSINTHRWSTSTWLLIHCWSSTTPPAPRLQCCIKIVRSSSSTRAPGPLKNWTIVATKERLPNCYPQRMIQWLISYWKMVPI